MPQLQQQKSINNILHTSSMYRDYFFRYVGRVYNNPIVRSIRKNKRAKRFLFFVRVTTAETNYIERRNFFLHGASVPGGY